jgi:hypothetical protein
MCLHPAPILRVLFFPEATAYAYTGLVKLASYAALIAVCCAFAFGADTPSATTIRWIEGAPNCTIQTRDDGHVYYGVSSGDFEVTLSVDRQELEMVPHRAMPMLGVFLSFRYKGRGQLEVQQNRFTLEFVKHFQVVQSSLDPSSMLQHLQQNIEDLTDEAERHQIPRHPDQKGKKEAELQSRLKDYTEMMDFISTRALRPGLLDSSNSSASGWVFFSTRNKWIGSWRKPEQLILRLPVENTIVEFPFELPPKQGKIELRRRDP